MVFKKLSENLVDDRKDAGPEIIGIDMIGVVLTSIANWVARSPFRRLVELNCFQQPKVSWP